MNCKRSKNIWKSCQYTDFFCSCQFFFVSFYCVAKLCFSWFMRRDLDVWNLAVNKSYNANQKSFSVREEEVKLMPFSKSLSTVHMNYNHKKHQHV